MFSGRQTDRIELLNTSDVVLYDDGQILPRVIPKMYITIIVHPRGRDIPDHISTHDLDMINGKMEEEHTRTMMSCGHAITPANLYDYCWNMLMQGRLEFTCPHVAFADHTQVNTCGTVWSLYEITIKARLSADERVLFEMKLNSNHCRGNKNIQSCPVCGAVCERLSLKNNRVICQFCLKLNKTCQEFCWQCLRPWTTVSNVYCGNRSCDTAKGLHVVQDLLNNCQRKNFDGYNACPAVRICPKCSSLLEHESGCKHMTCKCGYQFCFVCLRTWGTDCTHFKNCHVASVQRL